VEMDLSWIDKPIHVHNHHKTATVTKNTILVLQDV
jgi:hypothetical protein